MPYRLLAGAPALSDETLLARAAAGRYIKGFPPLAGPARIDGVASGTETDSSGARGNRRSRDAATSSGADRGGAAGGGGAAATPDRAGGRRGGHG
jgi:hypothetical protein